MHGCRESEDERLRAAYRRLGSVWKVGAELNLAGQTVHRRLQRLGVDTKMNYISEADKDIIYRYYTETPANVFNLNEIAGKIGRIKSTVSLVARSLGLTNPKRLKSDLAKSRHRGWTWKNNKNPHPRGMLGKRHTAKTLAIISQSSKRYWATCKTFNIGLMLPEYREKRRILQCELLAKRPASSNYTRTNGGYRKDIGNIYFRSSWEANYARYLNLLKKLGVVDKWEFEPEVFWFNGVKRGANNYKPDFKVWYRNDAKPEYVEVKGWVVAKDKTKWRRMKKYHPGIKLIVVGAKEYYSIQKKWEPSIPNWEKRDRSRRGPRFARSRK